MLITHFRIVDRLGKPRPACSARITSPIYAAYIHVRCHTCRTTKIYKALKDERTRLLIGATA